MQVSPKHWTIGHSNTDDKIHSHAIMQDANGKRIFDTFNSDVSCLETDRKTAVSFYYDRQGEADFRHILETDRFATDAREVITELLSTMRKPNIGEFCADETNCETCRYKRRKMESMNKAEELLNRVI